MDQASGLVRKSKKVSNDSLDLDNKDYLYKNIEDQINKMYKTELCRNFSDLGYCKYGIKCQFAHALSELRDAERHPRYKTEYCKNFLKEGTCKYGRRCCFLHINKETGEEEEDELVNEYVEKEEVIETDDNIVISEKITLSNEYEEKEDDAYSNDIWDSHPILIVKLRH
ncbi:hypothetical protein H311_03088, partial [Anncaliia algerae PRA109]